MKKMFGKLYKVILVFFVSLFFVQVSAGAYETVLIDFPNGGWHKVFYETRPKETIVQYVPEGQTKFRYGETLIFHSYKWTMNRNMSSQSLLKYHLSQASLKYRDIQHSTIKDDPLDSIAMWCSALASQCEIIRSTQGYEGIITMHYINNNPQYFQNVYPTWLEIIRKVRIYYSYYRWDSIMNKANSVEL